MAVDTPTDVAVDARGRVTDEDRAYVRAKVFHLAARAAEPVLYSRVTLTAHDDPARAKPAFAAAELDVNGNLVRAHVAAATMREAVDLLEARLATRLERFAHRAESQHLRHRGDGGVWRHGDLAAERPSYYPRPVDEREIVRRKTFVAGPVTPDEAAFDLEMLDHDFYLFTNLETGEDNVIGRAADGAYEVFEPSATCALSDAGVEIRHSPVRPTTTSVEGARAIFDATEAPFVFFVDAQTGRGSVLYRRYDGHYGLIVVADEAPRS
jgi:ribosome-associated translation inhibitor RaiA